MKCSICKSNRVHAENLFYNNWLLCKNCGHSSLISLSSLDKLSDQYESNNLAAKEPKARHFYAAKLLDSIKPKSVLDIGPGNYFPFQISKTSSTIIKYYGVDFQSNKLASTFSNILQISPREELNQAIPTSGIDFLLLDNCLEHLPCPYSSLSIYTSFLHTNSYVFVSCPNKYNLKNILNPNREYSFSDEHIQIFTSKSLDLLMSSFSLYPISLSNISLFSAHLPILTSQLGLPLFGLYRLYKYFPDF